MKSLPSFCRSLLPAAIALIAVQSADADTVYADTITEEIVVTADLRDGKLLEIANSVTVLNQEVIEARGARHLEQLLSLAPNVNFASGASRGRFFQVRGIGERSQFTEPRNPAVGVIVDGIDYTGLGLAASTLDIQQVEVLRGPQGTLYGANALAGLINLKSNSPDDEFTARIGVEMGSYDSRVVDAVISGPLSDRVGYRLAAQKNESDGNIENIFLNRDDTGNIDETNLRGTLQVAAGDNLTIDFTGHYLDADNGYDAFSLDNNRQTRSDQPGHDRQKTKAGSIRATWSGNEAFDLMGVISHGQSDTEYGFDEDWTFTGFHPDGYTSFDNFLRDNDNTSVDLRLVSSTADDELGWVVGVYHRSQSTDLLRQYSFDSDFSSSFDTENTALYGQLDIPLAEQLTLNAGLRFEQRDADYSDNRVDAYSLSENLWGGRIALEYQLGDDVLVYGLVSRGYSAGGANTAPEVLSLAPTFDTEIIWNYEIGGKGRWLDNRLLGQVALFYQDRKDVQTIESLVIPRPDGSTQFVGYTGNAASGESYGLEVEFNYQAMERVAFFGSFGLLETKLRSPANTSGREAAHAPNYQFHLGSRFDLSDSWYLNVELEGKDGFFFSDRHDEQSNAYELLNMRLGYTVDNVELALFARNLTDEDTQVRGFGSFGNDPRKGYVTEPYYQFGEPRVIGVSANYSF